MFNAFVVDDHPVTRWGLRSAVESIPDVRVTGMFGAGGEILANWGSPGPDLVLLDFHLADGLPALPLASELATRTKVFVLSASRHTADMVACRQAGVVGFLHKSVDADILVSALRHCLQGEACFPDLGVAERQQHALGCLSAREREVLIYIASGYTHDQTARRLGVSRHTVDTYLKRMRAKIGFGNKAHLTRAALSAGIRLDHV